MNNRNKNCISPRVKRGFKRYSTLDIGGLGLPEDIDAADYPFNEWLKQLAEIEDKGNWINDKLDTLGIVYHEEWSPYKTKKINEDGPGYRTSLTVLPFLDMHFLENGDKPITIFAISTDQTSGVVQLLMLAEKLKRTNEYVNVIIIFLDCERLEYGAQHLNDWMEDQEWIELVEGIMAPAGFYGSSICINNRHDSPLSAVWHKLMQEYQLDRSIEGEKQISFLYGKETNFEDNYDFVSIGFGPSDSLSDQELEGLNNSNQLLEFTEESYLKTCNKMLYQSAILLSDYYRRE